MLHKSPLATNESTSNKLASTSSPALRRQISSLIILLSLVCTLVNGIAQTKEQENRGLRQRPAPTTSSVNVTPADPGDKPELILQTGHTKSVNAVVFSP